MAKKKSAKKKTTAKKKAAKKKAATKKRSTAKKKAAKKKTTAKKKAAKKKVAKKKAAKKTPAKRKATKARGLKVEEFIEEGRFNLAALEDLQKRQMERISKRLEEKAREAAEKAAKRTAKKAGTKRKSAKKSPSRPDSALVGRLRRELRECRRKLRQMEAGIAIEEPGLTPYEEAPPWPDDVVKPRLTVDQAIARLSSAARKIREGGEGRGVKMAGRRMWMASRGILNLNPLIPVEGHPEFVGWVPPGRKKATRVGIKSPPTVRPRGTKRNKEMSAKEKAALMAKITRALGGK